MVSVEAVASLISSYISMSMEQGFEMPELLDKLTHLGFSRRDLSAMGVIVLGNGREVSFSGEDSMVAHRFNEHQVSSLLSSYLSVYKQATGATLESSDEREELVDCLERFGFTPEDLEVLNFERAIGPEELPHITTGPRATQAAPQKAQMREEDYTLEQCPSCEEEVVIRATGISRCPSCGRPILPCTKCSSCTTPCPYGYMGRWDKTLKPTNPPISHEEVEFFLKCVERESRQ